MNYQELMKLVNAGFTKQEILAITGQINAEPKPEPLKAPDPEPEKAPDPEPVKAPDPEPEKAPDQNQAAIDKLTEQVTKLTTLVQRSNILASEQPEIKQQSAEDIIASIIFPSFKGNDN